MIIITQSTYTGVEVGLHDGVSLIQEASLDKKEACAQLIPTINRLLQQENSTLTHVTHIIVNRGPAPFSSLRTVISSMNGIAYATDIPLFGVSAFDALNHVYNTDNTLNLLIVLRAYSKEYYYGLYRVHEEPIFGLCPSEKLPPATSQDTLIIGQTDLFSEAMRQNKSLISRSYCTLEEITRYGLYAISHELAPQKHISPLYIKNHF